MTWFANWNNVEPMLFIITIMMMIFFRLLSADRTSQCACFWKTLIFDSCMDSIARLSSFGILSTKFLCFFYCVFFVFLLFCSLSLQCFSLFASPILSLRFFRCFACIRSFPLRLAFFGCHVPLVGFPKTVFALVGESIRLSLVLVELRNRLVDSAQRASFGFHDIVVSDIQ